VFHLSRHVCGATGSQYGPESRGQESLVLFLYLFRSIQEHGKEKWENEEIPLKREYRHKDVEKGVCNGMIEEKKEMCVHGLDGHGVRQAAKRGGEDITFSSRSI
jgi:hypothetical protein